MTLGSTYLLGKCKIVLYCTQTARDFFTLRQTGLQRGTTIGSVVATLAVGLQKQGSQARHLYHF